MPVGALAYWTDRLVAKGVKHEALARRLQEAGGDDGERIRAAYLRLYGRPGRQREVELGVAFLKLPETPEPGEMKPALTRWEQYAQVLLSTNEFLYVD